MTGKVLWEMPVQSSPVSGPITYMLDGVQYIAVNAGWGGGAAQIERARVSSCRVHRRGCLSSRSAAMSSFRR